MLYTKSDLKSAQQMYKKQQKEMRIVVDTQDIQPTDKDDSKLIKQ